VVFGAGLGMVVGNTPITLFTFGLFLGPVTRGLGWENSTFAAALFVSQVGGAVSMPFVGRWIDRYGIRRVTLLCVVIFSVATVLVSVAQSLFLFLLLYGICGVSGAGRGPISYAKAISGWFQSRRGLALGIAFSGLGIGSALIPQLTRHLIADFGWRGAYIGLGILTFAVAFPTVALFIREPQQSATHWTAAATSQMQPPEIEPLAGEREERLTASPAFWLLIATGFLSSVALTGTVTLMVPLLTDTGRSIEFATWILSLAAFASAGGRLVSGYLLDHFLAAYVAASFFLLALGGIAFLNASSFYAAVLGGLFLGLGMGAETSILVFLLGRYFRYHRFGEACGFLFAVSVLGNGVGPWLMAESYDLAHSYNIALVAFGFALVAAVFFVLRLGPYRYPATEVLAESRP
jgi:MFS family permease